MSATSTFKADVQTLIKLFRNALQKNYQYNQEKYLYAKRITSSYISWIKYSFSENMLSHAYVFYAKPNKFKKFLNYCDFRFKKHRRGITFCLSFIQTSLIVGISIGIYYFALKSIEYFQKIDELIVI